LVLKSEDPTLDEELLNLKLERLRLLEQIRELEIENSSLTPFQEAPPETPTESTSSEGEEEEEEEDEDTSPNSSTDLTDEEFARKLLNEELTALKQTGKTQDQIRQAITQQVETLLEQDPNFAQNLSNLEKDEQLARKLEQQFLNTISYQIDEDERLAKKLQNDDYRVNSYYYTPPSSSPLIKKRPGLIPPKPLPTPASRKFFPMNRTTSETRKHAVEIHNRNCSCKKTTPGYNGHIFKIHDQWCSCTKLHST
jgi:hypothetical protein